MFDEAQHLIAVVDDDEEVRNATENLLQSYGFLSGSFASAEEFLNSGQVGRVDCLVTDVQMPGMSGVDLHALLIQRGSCPPTIFVTAFPDDRVRARAESAGAVAFLAKPFDADRLIECVNVALGARGDGVI